MQTGAKPVRNDAERQPGGCSKTRGALRFIGRALRKASFASLPLLASLALGCEPDKCATHNETTTPLNRPTDGRIATLAELSQPPQEGIISEAAIDLVNESQALSTGGMPGNAYLTLVERSCIELPTLARACWEGNAIQDRGVYTPSPVKLLSSHSDSYLNIRNLFHELGHLLQGGAGNEILPDINKYEQLLMVHVLLSRNDPGSQKMWGFLTRNVEDEIYPEGLPSYIGDAGAKQKIAVFNLLELIRSDGDFRSVRERLASLASSGMLYQEFDSLMSSYADEYGDPDLAREVTRVSNLVLSARMSFAREISRRFGAEASMAYLRAMSHKAVFSWETMTEGLGGMNCALMDRQDLALSEPGSGTSNARELCPELERTIAIHNVPEQRLCCVSPVPGSTGPGFQKYIVYADGYNCTGFLPPPAERTAGVRHLNVIRSVLLPDGARCE